MFGESFKVVGKRVVFKSISISFGFAWSMERQPIESLNDRIGSSAEGVSRMWILVVTSAEDRTKQLFYIKFEWISLSLTLLEKDKFLFIILLCQANGHELRFCLGVRKLMG